MSNVQCPVQSSSPISSSQVNLTCLPTCHSWTSSSCLPPHSWKSYHGKTVAIIDHITVLWETVVVVRWSFYDVVFFPAHLVHLFPEVFFRKFIICSLPRQQTPPVGTIGLFFSLNLVESLEFCFVMKICGRNKVFSICDLLSFLPWHPDPSSGPPKPEMMFSFLFWWLHLLYECEPGLLGFLLFLRHRLLSHVFNHLVKADDVQIWLYYNKRKDDISLLFLVR